MPTCPAGTAYNTATGQCDEIDLGPPPDGGGSKPTIQTIQQYRDKYCPWLAIVAAGAQAAGADGASDLAALHRDLCTTSSVVCKSKYRNLAQAIGGDTLVFYNGVCPVGGGGFWGSDGGFPWKWVAIGAGALTIVGVGIWAFTKD